MSDGSAFGAAVLGWWSRHLGDRESGPARALSARLRRAGSPVAVLTEAPVHELLRAAEATDADGQLRAAIREPAVLARLVLVLGEVRTHDVLPLAKRLGAGDPAVLSALRFRRLLSAEGTEATAALRRAVRRVDRRANVPRLAEDLLRWDGPVSGDRVRTRWCFDYYGGEAPAETEREAAR